MVGKIYITDEINNTSLLDVIRQVKSQKDATEFLVVIDSQGGYVDQGFAILDYLRNLKQPVHTYAKRAYSIASVIFMAGQRRIVDENATDVVMIHLPWLQPNAGSYDQIVNDIEELKQAENRLVSFYSSEIELPKETIKSLLSNDTFLSGKEALEMGFATELKAPQMAMAKLQNNIELESTNWMNKAEKILNKIAISLGIKAELILQDGTGASLVFPELNEGDNPEIGAKATIDSKPAEGDFVMPSGITMRFEGGELKEIVPAPAEDDESAENADDLPETDDAPADDKDARIAELEAENAELKARIEELEAADKADETQDKLLSIIEASTKKIVELEGNYQALAKSIGSDFTPDTKKETTPTVKASAEQKSRAWQILNS